MMKERAKSVIRLSLARLPARAKRRIWYALRQRKWPRFSNPQTFNEKINWRMLNDRRPIIGMTCDKLRVKEYAARHGVKTPATLWSGTDIHDLVHHELPERWVLKPNHSSGLVHFGNGRVVDADELARLTTGWIDDNTRVGLSEWAYTQARRLLLVEEMLGDGSEVPDDIRFFVFDGAPLYIQVESDTYTRHTRRIYTAKWEPLPVTQLYPLADPVPRPAQLAEMLQVAATLGRDFDFIRVDLYNVDGEIYLGELSPYPTSGLGRYEPSSFRLDEVLGAHWHLPRLS